MISVIVPIYGVEKYIKRCALSLMEQTYKDIEYVFVNDCTKDDSMKILQEVLCKYPDKNVLIINKDKNEGLPQARKTGFLASHGEYVIHFDSDDWVDKDCISKMYSCAFENKADIVMADYYEEYLNEQVIKRIPKIDDPKECVKLMLRAQLHSGVWNKLVHRNLYSGVEFPICNMHEDLATMVQVYSRAKVVSSINEPFYHYNLANVQSLTQQVVSFKKTFETYSNLKLLESFFKKNNLLSIYEAPFSNFVNTFKGAILMNKETRNIQWLKNLYPHSVKFIFRECRLSLLKKCLFWGAIHGFWFPFKIIDAIRGVVHKVEWKNVE